ncbi:V-set and immunoglobulin domain-containing protein 10-like [Myxocyprinus asiaticus]|uniref:V-set and immunoglobulin domain-containing protein 10-like n=1 Tax=Myxocyprinus asiaticus TaxID=70543 RepID=UPI002223CD79|nr:V-set and immunoglobulin domain-containing protein 10-like [Myxocyprinus asiaticus]
MMGQPVATVRIFTIVLCLFHLSHPTDGPANLSLDIKPATPLKNGTLFVKRGSNVFFNCSSEAYPSQNLTWMVEDVAQDDPYIASGSKSSLEFSISNILPSNQGIYTCASQNTFSMRTVNKSQELLVYYAPERHPECSWELGNEPSDVLFICSWYGGYPVPTLDWHEILEETVIAKGPMINTSQETERLEVHVNRFILHNKEEVKCVGHHITGVEKSCSFNLKMPYPLGAPLVTALEGSTVTLSCTETESLPPAKTVWKQKDNKLINSTSKYIVSESKPTYTLTIVNVTKDDEGIFYCYSENPLGARELELYLTVRTTAGGGAAVGVFVSVLIVMIGIVLGVTIYSKRDRICIGLGFSSLDDDRGDVLSLVDSDEEEIFHDAVPRLPPLTNGHATTLVEIHRIPSCDREENPDSTEHTDQTQHDQIEPENTEIF